MSYMTKVYNSISIEALDETTKEWRRISYIQYDPSRKVNRRVGDQVEYCRAGAIEQAQKWMEQWYRTPQFNKRLLRLVDHRSNTEVVL